MQGFFIKVEFKVLFRGFKSLVQYKFSLTEEFYNNVTIIEEISYVIKHLLVQTVPEYFGQREIEMVDSCKVAYRDLKVKEETFFYFYFQQTWDSRVFNCTCFCQFCQHYFQDILSRKIEDK